MKTILFTRKDTAELVEQPIPEPRNGEVRVKLIRSCISSGTERANIIGLPDSAVGIFTPIDRDSATWPRRAGYSSSGIVDKVGDGVSLKVGDRVCMSWSTHSEYVCLPAAQVYPIPDGVSFEHAAFTHISTFPMGAIRKCRLELGEGALIMGQGVLGQIAVILLKAAGALPVIAGDIDEAKRQRAIELGADYALDPSAPDFNEQVKSVTDNHQKVFKGYIDNCGPKVVIEVTGNGKALDTALDAIAPFGRIALLGCTRDSNFSIDYYHKVHGRGITLVGAHSNARPDFESSPGWWTTRNDALTFLKLLELKRISLDGFVEEVHPATRCGEVYARLAKFGAFPIVQFEW